MNYYFQAYIEKPERVDMYLSTLFPIYSRSFIQKIIDRWDLMVNGKVINKNLKIKNRDEIKIEIKNEKLVWVLPEEHKLDIIYEDDSLLIVNKDAGMNVHPVPWENWDKNTLVNAVLYHCGKKLPCISWVNRPWIVHRLDKDTSWIILIAKDDMMMSYLSWIIKDRKIEKEYIAIVAWILNEKEFKIESYIWRDSNDRLKMTTKNPINPKIAISYWEVMWYIWDEYTVIKMNIKTWRTHQIRVHLSSIWYPIIGDKVYGNKKVNNEVKEKYWLDRQALHAFELKFDLYWKKVKFKAELKDDIKNILSSNLIV